MASVTVVSPLAPEEQSRQLEEFVQEQGCNLQSADALAICKNLQLHQPTPSNLASGRIQEDLAARGIRLSRSVCCEALARICGSQSWMRMRQQVLSLASQGIEADGALCFCVHFVRQDGGPSDLVLKPALHELTEPILGKVRELWPTSPAPALCTVAVGKQGVTLELEHSDAPWLSVRVWSFRSSPEHSQAALPKLEDLPEQDVHGMLEKVERSLEYTHPGLLVVGTTRSEKLGVQFVYAPELQGNGFRRSCKSALDTYLWLGSCENEFSDLGNGVFELRTSEGPARLESRWWSEETGEVTPAPIAARQLRSILNRAARLRRVTGLTMTEFYATLASGSAAAGEPGAQPLDVQPIARGMEEKGWTAKDLADAANVPVSAVLRVLRYGYARVELVPKLSRALSMSDPNKLLAKEEGEQLGLRIDSAESFIRALRDTHMWRLVFGDGLQGAEEEQVAEIAESLKEYVELLQFESSTLNGQVKTVDGHLLEPLDERSVTADVQELLDALRELEVGVLVARNVRFMSGQGQFAHMNEMPLFQSTVFFEKLSRLKKPATFS